MNYNITRLRENLFNQEYQLFIEETIGILENISLKINELSKKEVYYYNNSISSLSKFLEMGDYLAVSDILKYEIIPLVD